MGNPDNRRSEGLPKHPVQVGGNKTQLDKHISAIDSHPLFSNKIDFKLAVSDGPSCDTAVRESHFDGLCVTLCQVNPMSANPGSSPLWQYAVWSLQQFRVACQL